MLEHEPQVRSFLRGLLPSWDDVDDVLQQAGLIAWRKFADFEEGTAFGGWFPTIARYEALAHRHGPQTWRRMLYQERMRRVDDGIFTAFDFPDCGHVRAKRPVSTTPLQALNLMNIDFVLEQARRIAERAGRDTGGDEIQSIDRCFELILGRAPDQQERKDCLALAKANDLSRVGQSKRSVARLPSINQLQ